MPIVEVLYLIKKNIKSNYEKYFTVKGTYTSLLSDKIYLSRLYKIRMGKKLNLRKPKTFTEKLNWLKLYDRNENYCMMVDKYAVRKYIADKIGDKYLVPILGLWKSVEEIDYSLLPNEFVLKCNHDNGVIICNNKKELDIENTNKELKFHLERDYYKKCREWPYKNIKRKIICEKFMKNNNHETLIDFKVFCFSGEPKLIMVNSGRFTNSGLKTDMYDMNWEHLEMQDGHYPMAGDIFEKPKCFDELCLLAKKLSYNIPFVRVDFNYWNGQLFFGELTFFHSAGFEAFYPLEWDEKIGEYLILPTKR